MEAEAFHSLIEKRYDGYREWALKFMCEAPEPMLWTRWLAPECDRTRLEENAVELTYELRRAKGRAHGRTGRRGDGQNARFARL